MTPQAFEALRALMRAADSPSMRAARDVLTLGARPVDAAPVHGITVQACRNAVQRVRSALKLATVAAGGKPAPKTRANLGASGKTSESACFLSNLHQSGE